MKLSPYAREQAKALPANVLWFFVCTDRVVHAAFPSNLDAKTWRNVNAPDAVIKLGRIVGDEVRTW
jgi:hypothetical protein